MKTPDHRIDGHGRPRASRHAWLLSAQTAQPRMAWLYHVRISATAFIDKDA